MPATMHYLKPSTKAKRPKLNEPMTRAVGEYFDSLQGEKPAQVYNLVLGEIELALIEATLKFTNNNQSQASIILGLNRGTFRKKMAFYGLL